MGSTSLWNVTSAAGLAGVAIATRAAPVWAAEVAGMSAANAVAAAPSPIQVFQAFLMIGPSSPRDWTSPTKCYRRPVSAGKSGAPTLIPGPQAVPYGLPVGASDV